MGLLFWRKKKAVEKVPEIPPESADTKVGVTMAELVINPSKEQRISRNLSRIATLKLAMADLERQGKSGTKDYANLKTEHDYRVMRSQAEKGGSPWRGSLTTSI